MQDIGIHLWQSTLFAAGAALLTLALRRRRAHVRYWIWFAASVKFLVPFAAIIAAGRALSWRAPVPALSVDQDVSVVWQTFTSLPAVAAAPMLPSMSGAVAARLPDVAMVATTIWLAGVAIIAATWLLRWRRISTLLGTAQPLQSGRTLDLLRRFEERIRARRPLLVVSAPSRFEPGIVGIVAPVLFWPRGMDDRLSDQELEAVLVHELSHARRHDNLVALIHMAVKALCWFHPPVHWIGARLLHERERACDEDVISSGSAPETYAASILRTCEVCLSAPLPCVAGVTGSDLKKRIEVIMRHQPAAALPARTRAALLVLAVGTIAAPLVVGLAMPPRILAQGQAAAPASPPSFEVASIKANKAGDNRVMIGLQPGGRYVATNVTPFLLIRNAYQMQDFQIIGAPDWLKNERFDINAKGDVPDQNTFFDPRSGPNRTQLMVRSLLADRFKLRSHMDKRELPIYNLVLARSDGKLGPKLTVSATDCAAMGRAGGPPPLPASPTERMLCGMRIGPGAVSGGGVPIGQLLTMLSMNVQRTVIDKTGLTARYDIDLSWTPDQMPARDPSAPSPPADPGASLFTALQEQLGLKLESARGPVDVLVIDSIEHPTVD